MRLTNYLLSPTLPISMPAITISSRENKTAFTLIELLMVIAILGVLAAIIFGVFQGVKDSQKPGEGEGRVERIISSFRAF